MRDLSSCGWILVGAPEKTTWKLINGVELCCNIKCDKVLQIQMFLRSLLAKLWITTTQFIAIASIVYSFPLFFLLNPLLLLPLSTLSLSLPGSVPSVCLWAGGAGCYLDDLVQEGEREFISCLPSGLCYLWYFNAILLNIKKKNPTFIRGGAQQLKGWKFTPCIWRGV